MASPSDVFRDEQRRERRIEFVERAFLKAIEGGGSLAWVARVKELGAHIEVEPGPNNGQKAWTDYVIADAAAAFDRIEKFRREGR